MHRFRLNPRLDPAALHEAFRARNRLHIPDFLEASDAELLFDYLSASRSWKLVFNSKDDVFELDRETQAGLSETQRRQFDQAVYAEARKGFQFRYETIRVPDAERERAERGTLLDDFARFLSGETALGFLRQVVGRPDITFADAQATAYGPNHFLTAHDDDTAGKNRRAAFVVNLTREWSPDWGGLLLFHRAGEAMAEAMIPRFNSINLFAVPQVHSVSMVTPFAARRRYSITGWLRGGEKP